MPYIVVGASAAAGLLKNIANSITILILVLSALLICIADTVWTWPPLAANFHSREIISAFR
ncbi:MAG: hypothetical protein EBV03_13175 [Proteobacteria bacterium]|nr:hypothetical protein [Pseudomonadota bacterium]